MAIYNEKLKTDLSKNYVYFNPDNKIVTLVLQLPKAYNNFPNITDLQPPATAKL
jgi:hypothetical protein